MSASSGFESASTEHLVKVVQNIRAGLDRASEIPLETLNKGDNKAKQSPPIFSLAFQGVLMLPVIEAELFSRGIDPRSIPGTDWTEILMDQESN